jgi:hypothetical protein
MKPQTQVKAPMAPARIVPENKASNSKVTYYIWKGNNRKFSYCFRLVNLIVFLCVFISVFVRAGVYIEDGIAYAMTYVTNISMLVLVIYLAVGTIHAKKDRTEDETISKAYRALQILSCTSQLVVVIFYWSLIGPENVPNYSDWCDFLFYCHLHNFFVHGLGLVPTMTELFNQPSKIQYKDIWIPLVYVVGYCCILIPTTLYGKQLYPGITFKDTASWIYTFGAIFLTFLSFSFVWIISGCQHKKYFGKKL